MKRVILGFALGVFVFVAFIFFGGAEFLQTFGKKTIEAGEELEQYEVQLKKSSEKLKDKLDEARIAAKEKIGEKAEEVIEGVVEETKEKIIDSF